MEEEEEEEEEEEQEEVYGRIRHGRSGAFESPLGVVQARRSPKCGGWPPECRTGQPAARLAGPPSGTWKEMLSTTTF